MKIVLLLPLFATLSAAADPLPSIGIDDVIGECSFNKRYQFRFGRAGNEWNNQAVKWTPSGRPFVGTDVSGEEIRFSIEDLPAHANVLVLVKLMVIYHWDGNWAAYGPDTIRVAVDGDRELMRSSFSNFSTVRQSYPDDWPWGSFPARSAAVEEGTLGWKFPGGWGQALDAVYDVWLAFPHSTPELRLDFQGDFHDKLDPMRLQGEQWGIESLEVFTFKDQLGLEEAESDRLVEALLSTDPKEIEKAKAILPLDRNRSESALERACKNNGLYPLGEEDEAARKEDVPEVEKKMLAARVHAYLQRQGSLDHEWRRYLKSIKDDEP